MGSRTPSPPPSNSSRSSRLDTPSRRPQTLTTAATNINNSIANTTNNNLATQQFSHAPSTNTNDTMADFMHYESMYIEPTETKTSQSLVPNNNNNNNNNMMMTTTAAATTTANSTSTTNNNNINNNNNMTKDDNSDANSKRKRREERQQRLAMEQVERLREKFDLPMTEQLIASFSAALLKNILLQGRMYITSHHICFYTKLFGKVTKEAFPYTSLSRVKKRRGGLVANAIKIFFTDQNITPIIFGSLNHREKAFNLIQERLRALNPLAAEPRQQQDDDDDDNENDNENDDDDDDVVDEEDGSAPSVGSGPADSEDPSIIEGRNELNNNQNILRSAMPVRQQMDSLTISSSSRNEMSTTTDNHHHQHVTVNNNTAVIRTTRNSNAGILMTHSATNNSTRPMHMPRGGYVRSNGNINANGLGYVKHHRRHDMMTTRSNESSSQHTSDMGGDIISSSPSMDQFLQQQQQDEWESSLIWCTPDDIVGKPSLSTFEKKSERAQGILNSSVKDAFNLLYVSDWLKDYHESVNHYEVTISSWQRDEQSGGYMSRDVQFRRPMGYRLGPKETRVREKQRYSFTDKGGVVIEVQGENLDVPYGNYFFVESYYELTPHNEGTQTLFTLSVAVNFVKTPMLQSKIESTTLNETKTAYERLLKLAMKRVDEHVTERRSIRRQQQQQQQQGELRKRKSAPSKNRNGINGNAVDHIQMNGSINHHQQQQLLQLDGLHRAATIQPLSPVERRDNNNLNSSNNSNHNTNGMDATDENTPMKTKMATTNTKNVVGIVNENNKGKGGNGVVEIRDSNETQRLKMAAVGLLILAFVLLFVIASVLNRVHLLMKTLEKVINNIGETSRQAASNNQC